MSTSNKKNGQLLMISLNTNRYFTLMPAIMSGFNTGSAKTNHTRSVCRMAIITLAIPNSGERDSKAAGPSGDFKKFLRDCDASR